MSVLLKVKIFYPHLSVHGAHMTLIFTFLNIIGDRGYKTVISILAALNFQHLQSSNMPLHRAAIKYQW